MKVLSFGAGVQSTTMLLMSLTGDIERADCAIFADTGWEPKATYEHLKWMLDFCAWNKMPLHIVSAGDLRQDVLLMSRGKAARAAQPPLYVINRKGIEGVPPVSGGTLWRQCTKEYKIEPIKAKVRELLGVPKGKRVPKGTIVEMRKGISLDEAHRMKDSRDAWIVNRYPLIDARMTRDDCVRWLKANGHAVPEKSACIGCPFHSNSFWRDQMLNRPDEFKDAEEFDTTLREQPYPNVTGQVYVHRRMLPLREAVLSTMGDPAQTDLFGEECDGVCGV